MTRDPAALRYCQAVAALRADLRSRGGSDRHTANALDAELARYRRGDLSEPASSIPAGGSRVSRAEQWTDVHARYYVWLRYGPGADLLGDAKITAERTFRELNGQVNRARS